VNRHDDGCGVGVADPARAGSAPPPVGDTPPAVSLIVPTRNEGDNVRRLRDRVARALAGMAWELVVVDDSDDDTPARLKALAAADPRVRVHLRGGGGLASAVVAGATLARAPYAVVLDADLQHPPEVVPRLLAALAAGADLAVASRFGAAAPAGALGALPWARRLHTRLARGLVRAVLREARRTADPLSGFFACRRAHLLALGPRPLGWKLLLDVLVLARPDRVRDVPYAFAPRRDGRSKLSARVEFACLRQLLALAARGRPLAAAGRGGLGLVLNLAAYGLGLAAGLSPPVSGLLAAHAAVAGSLLLHARPKRRGLARFLCCAELGAAVAVAVIAAAGRVLPGHAWLADVGGVGVALPATRWASDRWPWPR
jgi:dolichol-phosphate mannosyltransferase